jgi:hypothetical protein
MFERHFKPAELAAVWNYSESTIVRWFRDEPGVLKCLPKKRRSGARVRVELRIPESVAGRVYLERTGTIST